MFLHPGWLRDMTTYLERTASSRSGSAAEKDIVTMVTSTSSGTGRPYTRGGAEEPDKASSNHSEGICRANPAQEHLDAPVMVNLGSRPRSRNVFARGSCASRPGRS